LRRGESRSYKGRDEMGVMRDAYRQELVYSEVLFGGYEAKFEE
jgi:hypothetical protein